MKIGFIINDIATERPVYTTVRIAMEAVNRGHEAWLIGVGDLTYAASEVVEAQAYRAPAKRYRSATAYLEQIKGKEAKPERIIVDELDILMLRNDPAVEVGYRDWAKSAGIIFGRVAQRSGLIVLNNPDGLSEALDKMYVNQMPEAVRPRAIITQSSSDIKAFVKDIGGRVVLKGMQGTGNQSVFLVTPENRANLNQMIEAVSRDDYVIAEEYVEQADGGSTRLFLMNGEPLRHKGKVAAFQWIRSVEETRANIHSSGTTTQAVKLTDADFQIAEAVRPRLVQDGMFLAGLHIVQGKLLDIDVFSPGGLGNAQTIEKVNFCDAVVTALENKVAYMGYYHRNVDHVDMATL